MSHPACGGLDLFGSQCPSFAIGGAPEGGQMEGSYDSQFVVFRKVQQQGHIRLQRLFSLPELSLG